ncbi:CDP-glycerol glycerophosphotransferase (TagB/SpsB family) [Bacilli bacterium PM5-3]|nr:CDP-glycerol glycerophosphotransferase (TagB/SpsB family) [Bacilli bacterium PM5-3]
MLNKVRKKIRKISFKIDCKNECVVITTKSKSAIFLYFKINGKKYKFKNKSIKIELTQAIFNSLLNKKYKVGFNGIFKKVEVVPNRVNLKYKKSDTLFYKEKILKRDNGMNVVITDIIENEEKIKIDLKITNLFKKIKNGKVIFNAKDKVVLEKYLENIEFKDGVANLSISFTDEEFMNFDSKNTTMFIYNEENATYFSEISLRKKYTIERLEYNISFYQKKKILYVDKNNSNVPNSSFNNLGLSKKSKYIKEIEFYKLNDELVITPKKSFSKINIYLMNIKTHQRNLIHESKYYDEIILSDIKNLMNIKCNKIEKFIFEYEIIYKNETVEKNYLFIKYPKKRSIDEYTLAHHHNNILTYFESGALMIMNDKSNFIIDNRFNYDLSVSTVKFHGEVTEINSEKIFMDIEVTSLLSKIKKIYIFANDSYKKHEILLLEIDDIGKHKVEKSIEINYQMIKSMYYNARYNFKATVEFYGNYFEKMFITSKYCEMSNDLRYDKSYYDQENDLIYAIYNGVNVNNLNLWITSKKEYEKGVAFQEARDEYEYQINNKPIDNKMIFFEAFLGKNYAGSPKYIYEYMLKSDKYKDYNFVWSYVKDASDIPGNPIVVERGSKDYFKYLGLAKYWVNNIIFPVKTKRKETIYLQTWHGTPLKKLGFDIKIDGPEKRSFANLYKESKNWDYLLVDNDYADEKLVNAFKFKKEVIKKGYPINDIFYNKEKVNEVTKKIKDKYNLDNRKIILYAPTWRDLDGDYTNGFDFELPFDLKKLYESFNDEYQIIVKVHHLIASSLNIQNEYSNFVYNVSDNDDIQELLCCTDILITDYSSVFYDFSNRRKPIIFYMYDYDRYLNKTRGLYIDVNDLPGPIVKNTEHLIKEINDINENKFEYEKSLNDFCQEFTKYNNGKSSQAIVDIMMGSERND